MNRLSVSIVGCNLIFYNLIGINNRKHVYNQYNKIYWQWRSEVVIVGYIIVNIVVVNETVAVNAVAMAHVDDPSGAHSLLFSRR